MCVRDLPEGVRRRRAQGLGLLLLSQLAAVGEFAPLLGGWHTVIAAVLLALSASAFSLAKYTKI